MKLFGKTVLGFTTTSIAYGYYLSKKYESIPFYKLPSDMQINKIVQERSKADNHKYFFAYCNTYGSKIHLNPDKLNQFQNQKQVIDAVLVSFFNNKFNQLLLSRPLSVEDLNNENHETFKISKSGNTNSVVVEIHTPQRAQDIFEKLSDYGFPYRINSTTVQEVFVELTPEINTNTNTIEGYSADILFSWADEYGKHDYDGKILPRAILSVNRFFSRILFQTGAYNVARELGN